MTIIQLGSKYNFKKEKKWKKIFFLENWYLLQRKYELKQQKCITSIFFISFGFYKNLKKIKSRGRKCFQCGLPFYLSSLVTYTVFNEGSKTVSFGTDFKVQWLSSYRHSLIYTVNVGTHKKPAESKNCINQDYLEVLKGRKIGYNYKPR